MSLGETPGGNHPKREVVHKRGEEASAGRVEMSARRIAARVKRKVYRKVVRPAVVYDLEMVVLIVWRQS